MKMSWLREQLELVRKAEEGDPDAILEVVEMAPITVLREYPKIAYHVWYMTELNRRGRRAFVEKVIEAIRKGLLKPKAGRPSHVPRDAGRLAAKLQSAYEAAPIRLKRKYRNPAAKRLDTKAIASHVASSFDSASRQQIASAVVEVLSSAPRTRTRFGDLVAAKLFLCSPRYIQSLRKRA